MTNPNPTESPPEPPEQGQAILFIRLPRQDKTALAAIAAEEGDTMQGIIRRKVRAMVKEWTAKRRREHHGQ